MDYSAQRQAMVETQIIPRGIDSPALLDALRQVPRHKFVPENEIKFSYQDTPLAIGDGQTISQPYIVALMSDCLKLKKTDIVLEVGTGSGYQTAVLAELCKEVYTIERIEGLSLKAQNVLDELNYINIKYFIGDGSHGINNHSVKFNAIIITAAAADPLEALQNDLFPDGRMILPIGSRISQKLTLFTRKEQGVESQEICLCSFVPLIAQP